MTQPYHVLEKPYEPERSAVTGPDRWKVFATHLGCIKISALLNEQHAEIERLRAILKAFNPEDGGREATRSVKEDCSRGYQRCHECDDFDCGDNMSDKETSP